MLNGADCRIFAAAVAPVAPMPGMNGRDGQRLSNIMVVGGLETAAPGPSHQKWRLGELKEGERAVGSLFMNVTTRLNSPWVGAYVQDILAQLEGDAGPAVRRTYGSNLRRRSMYCRSISSLLRR